MLSAVIIVHGLDLIEMERFGKVSERWGNHFLNKIFTPAEITCYKFRLFSLAAHFAAKEAVMKALGRGYGHIGWHEIEVLPDKEGKPQVYLHGRAKKRSQEIGLKQIALSLSHTHNYALAAAVGVISGPKELLEGNW